MLHSAPGTCLSAAQLVGDPPVHQLSLCFERERFRVQRQDPPWKVVRAFALPGSGKLVHLNNVSGGVLAGDSLALDVEVAPGAVAQITTTGATRLYRHRSGEADSAQHTTLSIGDAAQLEYLPDVVIPYAGSRHLQRTKIQLGRGATLFWWEILASGREATGERFAFECLRVETEIVTSGRLLLREDFSLEPARRKLQTEARMSKYSHMASFCVAQEGRPAAFWRTLENQLNQIAQTRTAPQESVWGASALVSDGIVVRGLGMTGRHIDGALVDFWSTARRAVTGTEAVLPRKVY